MQDYHPINLDSLLLFRPGLEHPSEARKRLHFNDQFDIAVIGAFEKEEDAEHLRPVYSSLAQVLREDGRTVFIPHEHYDESTDETIRRFAQITNQIAIPTSAMTVAYIGKQTMALGYWLQTAVTFQKPIVAFYEKGSHNNEQLIEQIQWAQSFVKTAFDEQPTNYRLLSLEGETIDEAIRLVRNVVREAFDPKHS